MSIQSHFIITLVVIFNLSLWLSIFQTITAEQATAFARSIREWPPFPDTTSALEYLQKHHKLVIISNVDNESFERSRRKMGINFDMICTAQDIVIATLFIHIPS
jgi:FMN phosphatase YigB (HAD superfamily)